MSTSEGQHSSDDLETVRVARFGLFAQLQRRASEYTGRRMLRIVQEIHGCGKRSSAHNWYD